MKILYLLIFITLSSTHVTSQTPSTVDLENLPVEPIDSATASLLFGPQIVGFPVNTTPKDQLEKQSWTIKGRVEAMSGFVTGCNLVYCTASTAKIRLVTKTGKEESAYVVFRNSRSAVILGNEVKLSVHYIRPEDFSHYLHIYNEFQTDQAFLMVEE